MRNLAAAGLLLISACDHRTAAAKPTWEQPGLVATGDVGNALSCASTLRPTVVC
jgi:hypothetical protein